MEQTIRVDEIKVVLFVYNPVSGQHKNTENSGIYAKILEEIFPVAEIITAATQYVGHATELAQTFAHSAQPETVLMVVVGGDGTVSETANGLANTGIPLLILPGGTGNDLSRSLYQTKTREGTLRNITEILTEFQQTVALTGRVRQIGIDGALVTAKRVKDLHGSGQRDFKRYSFNVVSAGFDSLVASTAHKINRRLPWIGAGSYLLAALRNLSRLPRFKMRFTASLANTEILDVNEEYLLCVVSNARFYGGGFQPNPRGLLTDGKLDVVLAKSLSRTEISKVVGKFRNGYEIPAEYARSFQADEIVMEDSGEQGFIFNVDGEVFQAASLQVGIETDCLQVILPLAKELPPVFR